MPCPSARIIRLRWQRCRNGFPDPCRRAAKPCSSVFHMAWAARSAVWCWARAGIDLERSLSIWWRRVLPWEEQGRPGYRIVGNYNIMRRKNEKADPASLIATAGIGSIAIRIDCLRNGANDTRRSGRRRPAAEIDRLVKRDREGLRARICEGASHVSNTH